MKKKILFCPFIFEKGGSCHLNTRLIKIMAVDNDVTVLTNKSYLTDDVFPAIVLENKSYKIQSGIRNIIGIIHNIQIAARYANIKKPDLVFIPVYETKTFALVRFLFRNKNNLVILENNNIDHLNSVLNRFLYKTFAKKIKHFVFEDFISEYLQKQYKIPSNKVIVLPHATYSNEFAYFDTKNEGQHFHCVAISSSNEERLISGLVEAEKKTSYLKENRIRMFIKSRSINYSDGFLVVKTGFLPDEKYKALYYGCKVVYVPFDESYKYRMSGNIVDAFSAHKRVIASNFLLAKEYSKLYPDLLYVESNPETVLERIVVLSQSNITPDFSKFESLHSDERIMKSIKDAITKE